MARIALICPAFEPCLSYQEWVLAKSLAKMGHDVLVVTCNSECCLPESLNLIGKFPRIKVERLSCIGLRQTKIPVDIGKLRRLCRDQDMAIVNVPNHGFGYRAMKVLPKTLPMVVFFGDLLDNRRQMHPLVKWIKDRWYRWIFRRADHVFCNTPEALSILEGIGLGPHAGKAKVIGLPFDEDSFFFDKALSLSNRLCLTLISVTRPSPQKPFHKWFEIVFKFLESHSDWKYRFVGLGDDSSSRQIRSMVEESGFSSRIELFPAMDSTSLRGFYMDADLAFFPQATIGIQQAMATGLPVLLPRRLTVSHLLNEGENGFYFPNLESAPATLNFAANHIWGDRAEIASKNLKWSGEQFAKKMIADWEAKSKSDACGAL